MTDKEKALLADLIGFTGKKISDVEDIFDEYPDNDNRDFKFRYVGEVEGISVDITVDFDYTVRCSFSQEGNEEDDNFAAVPDFEIGTENLADWFERFKAGER
jgi:hypothetical protein